VSVSDILGKKISEEKMNVKEESEKRVGDEVVVI
jgi:hypothetical protein